MKKIGIMTFHEAYNYGAFLQAYALQQTISEQFECEIVNYHNELMYKSYHICLFDKNPFHFAKKLAYFLLYNRYYRDVIKRNRLFKGFSKRYFKTSKKFVTKDIFKANNYFDAFVSGSDQVWNPDCALSWDYFLEFADETKKYSYAGSFGGDIKLENAKRIKNDLSSFRSLLVREKKALDIISSLEINITPQLVCDPTFLLSKEQWIKNLQLKKEKGNYVFAYIVAEEKYSLDFARAIAKSNNLEIIVIRPHKNAKSYIFETESRIDVSPKEFLELILNAKCVVTTSFHGLALSLILNTNVYYELNHKDNNANSRLETLSDVFEIHDREIISNNACLNEMNWEKINNILGNYSAKSKNILFNSLADIK